MDKRIQVLESIVKDAENDAAEMDGKPFTGKTVATYFGYHGASIAALAEILKSALEEIALLNKGAKDKPSVATKMPNEQNDS